ncbi:ABC transporter permease protein NatB [Burkholderiales bacterium]|nr:MAG: ABC transporter permease [Burkholderiales bacterium]CAG0972200.1 ABC transporter permease protein NatB [Burkholderiales bacterium]
MMFTVFFKELRDQMRDRRALLGSLLPVVMTGPLMFFILFAVVSEVQEKAERFELPVLNAERAPALLTYLGNQNVRIVPVPQDYLHQLRDGKLDVVLAIPEGYAQSLREARPAEVELIYDSSRDRAMPSVRRTERLLHSYSLQVGTLRLMMRGIAPDLLEALRTVDSDIANTQQKGAPLMMFLGIYAVLTLLIGCMHVGIDMTAGERERGSLEPLLLNPLPGWQLLAGKWATGLVFSLLATLGYLLGFYLPIRFMPLHQIDLQIVFGWREIFLTLFTLAPLACAATAAVLLIGLLAKTHKEAQTSASFLVLVVMMVPALQLISPTKAALFYMPLPVYGQNLLLTAITRGESLPWHYFAVSAGSALALAALLLLAAALMLRRERIIFGR